MESSSSTEITCTTLPSVSTALIGPITGAEEAKEEDTCLDTTASTAGG
jgi:hypothetical protein